MRIVCICYEDIAGYAGSNRQVIELVKSLKQLGHKVKLTTPSINRLPGDKSEGIEYIPVINLPVLRYLSYLIFSPFFLIRVFLNFKPDVVFVFQIYLDLGSLLICKLFKSPLVFFINGIASEELGLTRIPTCIIYIFELIQKIYAKFSDKIFVVTKVVKEYLHTKNNIPLEKIEILKDAVDIEDFKPMEKEEARRILGLEKGNNLVGFLGSLYPWHGVDYLIDSAPLVLKEIPNTKFIIAGSGPMAKALINQTKKSGLEGEIIFTGLVPFSQAPVYINAFDICVVFFKPVRKNPGDPIKLYEYLACNKPVIASNVEGYGDVVERAGAGLSVDARNPQLLADAVVRLIKNKALREEMSEKGRFAVKEHTWGKRASEIERVFLEIINT